MTDPNARANIPNHDELVAILSAEGAPPVITLDIGGSEDLNGNGLVEARLDDQGQLVFRDI